MLNETELSDILEHASKYYKFQPGAENKHISGFAIIAYCSERISQVPFQLSFDDKYIDKAGVVRKLNFLNGVIGRIAQLEGKQQEASSYTNFAVGRKNQVDDFLKAVGYLRE